MVPADVVQARAVNLKQLARTVLPETVATRRSRVRHVARVGLPNPKRYAAGRAVGALEVSKFGFLPPNSLSDDLVVVDVGAHRGDWAASVRSVAPSARLILVEPTPPTVALLRSRFADDADTTIHPVAVGDHDGTDTLHAFGSSDFNSLLPLDDSIRDHYASKLGEEGSVEVPVTTLDSLLADVDHVDVLKIDVQGYEAAVLAGASSVLARTTNIVIETNFMSHYRGDSLIWSLHPQLEQAGFRLHRFGHLRHDRDGRLLWADAVYTRSP